MRFNLKNFKTSKCDDNYCITCKFIYEKNFIKINSFILPIISNCTCKSKDLIYIIMCIKCNVYYIGQTSRQFATRFKEHVYNICNFKHLIILNSEMSIHFNKTKHNLYNDLRYFIFKDGLFDLHQRLSTETDLIHIFEALNIKTINAMLPSLHKIKKLSFT